MALQDLVIHSQLLPPRQRRGVLRRRRLETRLLEVLDYPLTVVQAGTGYGKSTALAALTGLVDRLCWYTINEPDRDPLLFLAHLICAFERLEPALCRPALDLLEEVGGRFTPQVLTPLLNTLTRELTEEVVLVLDDYHLVADVPEIAALVERLVDYVPPCLHVVLSSRQMPLLPALTRWRVKGQVLTLTRAELAFTADEIEALFHQEYGYPLAPEQVAVLAVETEGWAIALQMVWQSLQSGAPVLSPLPSTMETLFDYLAHDVLARQTEAVQRFLLTTSVLREMDGAACDALLGVTGSAATLQQLHESGLFLVSAGEAVYRYHRLFHDFLRTQLAQEAEQAREFQRRAAAHFRQAGHLEETVYHLLEADEPDQAALTLEEIGPRLLGVGRYDSLTSWIGRLPEPVRAAHPDMELLLGEVLRLRARFDEALERYAVAEQLYLAQGNRQGRSRALRGQAEVYLDTVRPLKADSLLEEALRLLEPQEFRDEVAALLDKMAENKLNLGSPHEAQALHHEAGLLRAEDDPGDVYLEARAMLRTGQLAAGRRLLEARAEDERLATTLRPQRFHRETALLLSLICVLQGDGDAARRYALEGIDVGRRLGSPFVEAVGTIRLGHSLQLHAVEPWNLARRQEAIGLYHQAIDLVRVFKVLRVQVEPLWGLCRAHGYGGDLAAAVELATEAVDIARRAGDEWIGLLVHVTIGASLAMAGQREAAERWLSQAVAGFERVGDPFCQAAARLWLALAAWWAGEADEALAHLARLLPVTAAAGYDCLLTQRTHLGLKDDQAAIPLLVEAQRRGLHAAYAGRLLDGLGLAEVEYHPGYTLAVRTLGPFAAWRGGAEISVRDWKREKARQIFQLLVTQRGQWFHRDQIVEQLWPHLPPEAAERDFKVALNALNRVLEPDRPANAPPFLIVRRGNVYGLNPAARIVVDADEMERLAAAGDPDSLRQATALYEDDYLPDSLYEDWSAPERQRLQRIYLQAAERLARSLVRSRDWTEAVDTCERILARDPCWEAAYRLLMRIYADQGNRSQVLSTYQRCVQTLRQEMAVEPSPETRALLDKLTA